MAGVLSRKAGGLVPQPHSLARRRFCGCVIRARTIAAFGGCGHALVNRTPWHAADFVAASFVLGQSQLSADAATHLLHTSNLPSPVMDLARKIVQDRLEQIAIPEIDLLEGDSLHREIHRL